MRPSFASVPLLLALAARAQTPPPTPVTVQATPPATEQLVFAAGELKLRDLIDRSAAFLGWNVLVNEQELASTSQASIALQQQIRMTRADCEAVFTSLLGTQDFVLTPVDASRKLYEAVSLRGPRARTIFDRAVTRTPDDVLANANVCIPVTTTVMLQHVNGVIAVNALRPFFAATGSPSGMLQLGTTGGAGLVLCGLQPQVASAIRMLRETDVPQKTGEPGASERIEMLERRVKALEEKLEKR